MKITRELETLRFDSEREELIAEIRERVLQAGWLADGIAETPLRQIIDACVCVANATIKNFDKDRYESDEVYAKDWHDLNAANNRFTSGRRAAVKVCGEDNKCQ
jgi:hypothetical protein